jgi:radical SAM superfamily enzyme YgiQ (UPF0313 family)
LKKYSLKRKDRTLFLQPLFVYPEKLPLALTTLSVHWFFNAFEDALPDLLTSDNEKGVFSGKYLNDSPVVFVSLSYGANLINFVNMMKNRGIPVLKKERDSGMYPVFICGGIAAMLNPHAFTEIFDAVFVGEGECMENDIKKILSMETREDLFSFMDNLSYCYTKNKKSAEIVRADNGGFFVHSNPKLHSMGNNFDNRLMMELNRSCTSRCKFCAAAYTYKTFRIPQREKVIDYVKAALKNNSGIALMGTSLGSVSYFDEILELAAYKNSSISLSSLKIKEINENRLKLLKKCGVKTVTVAIESANYSTRKEILKDIPDSRIIDAMKLIKKYDFKSKLYFMAGLPFTDPETEAKSVAKLISLIDENNGLGEVVLSVAPFVPKNMTPFSSFKLMKKKEYKKYMQTLRKSLQSLRRNIKVDFFSYKDSELDQLLGFADGEVLQKIIREAHDSSG